MIERDPEFRAKFHKGLAFLLAIFVVTLLLGMLTGCALFKGDTSTCTEPVSAMGARRCG